MRNRLLVGVVALALGLGAHVGTVAADSPDVPVESTGLPTTSDSIGDPGATVEPSGLPVDQPAAAPSDPAEAPSDPAQAPSDPAAIDPFDGSATVSPPSTPAPVNETGAPAGSLALRGSVTQIGPPLPAIPDEWILPADSGTGRRIVYSNSLMRIWAVEEDGTIAKTHRVSGKVGIPYAGSYHVYSRSLHTFAEHDPSIVWDYMVRFAYTPNGGRVGFHEIPSRCGSFGCYKLQTEEQLGEALSGGCVRQATSDAIWVWNWASVGTTVVVLP